MLMNAVPCRECGSRHQGCHGQCATYAAWKQAWEAEKELMRPDEGRLYHREQSTARHAYGLRQQLRGRGKK